MIESPNINLTEENPIVLPTPTPVKNILQDIEYIEPNPRLPVPNGMCVDCNIEDNV